jgi:hypothetical protein
VATLAEKIRSADRLIELALQTRRILVEKLQAANLTDELPPDSSSVVRSERGGTAGPIVGEPHEVQAFLLGQIEFYSTQIDTLRYYKNQIKQRFASLAEQ